MITTIFAIIGVIFTIILLFSLTIAILIQVEESRRK